MYQIIESMLDGFVTIFKSPSNDWSVLWLLSPILLFWIVLEVYFDFHKKEALGWNTALGNGLSLFWVAISCVKFVFAQIMANELTKSFGIDIYWRVIWIFLIFAYSIFVISVSFNHKLKDKWVYLLAAPTPIYFLSIVLVLFSYGVLEFNWMILFDLFLLYWIILGLELTIRHFTPEDNRFSENDTLSGTNNQANSTTDPFGGSNNSYSQSSSSDPFGSSSSSSLGSTSNSDPFSNNNNNSSKNSFDDFKF